MPQLNDLSRSLIPFDQATTLVAVIELSQSSWLIAGTIPGIERQPLKKIAPDETVLLGVLHRWRDEATRKGRAITRIAVAFEAGRDGFWLARWLTGHGIEAHIIHSSSVAVSREHKRAKTDRLDTAMLMRVFLGWLRGERDHCGMVAIPTIEEEDAKRPSRERENLVGESTHHQSLEVGSDPARHPWFQAAAAQGATASRVAAHTRRFADPTEHARRNAARPDPAGLNTRADQRNRTGPLGASGASAADQAERNDLDAGQHPWSWHRNGRNVGAGSALPHLRDRRAVGRYAGLTGAPDESGSKRREKGLTKSGNARVRRGLIQLAWRFLLFQKDSALTQWFRSRTEGVKGKHKTKMIVALARKLLIALWRMVTTGEVPHGVVLREAA